MGFTWTMNPAALAAALPRDLVCAANGQHRLLTDFDFLGVALGTGAFFASHTISRSAAAGKLLDAIAQLEGPQVGVRLLRHQCCFQPTGAQHAVCAPYGAAGCFDYI